MAAQGDLATSKLTYLASQNKFGNIKALKPDASEPTVDPTTPVAQQEEEVAGTGDGDGILGKRKKKAQTLELGSEEINNALRQQVSDYNNKIREDSAARLREMQENSPAPTIFDMARVAKEYTI